MLAPGFRGYTDEEQIELSAMMETQLVWEERVSEPRFTWDPNQQVGVLWRKTKTGKDFCIGFND